MPQIAVTFMTVAPHFVVLQCDLQVMASHSQKFFFVGHDMINLLHGATAAIYCPAGILP